MDDIKVPYPLGPTTPSSHRSECTAYRGDHCSLILSLAQILFFFVFGWDNEWILILNLADVIIIKSLCASSCIRPSHFLTNTVCPVPPLRLLPISNTPFGVAINAYGFCNNSGFIFLFFFMGQGCWPYSLSPVRQPGEPGGHSLSAFYPSTCSALAGPTRSKRL